MSIRPKVRFAVLNRDKFTCRYCGRKPPNVVLHVDHVTSRYDGGSDEPDNLVAACKDCNLGKHSTSVKQDPQIPDGPLEFRPEPKLHVVHDIDSERKLLLALQYANDISFKRHLLGRGMDAWTDMLGEAFSSFSNEDHCRVEDLEESNA